MLGLRLPRVALKLAVCVMLASLPSRSLVAQSAQRFSLQLAALSTSVDFGTGGPTTGFGLEPQFRMNQLYSTSRVVVSLGLGGQWTSHRAGLDTLTITGAFLEPRVLFLTSKRIAPYLSGRAAMLRQSSNMGTSSSGSAFGVGGGIAYALSQRINLDAGVALLSQQFGTFVLNDGGSASFSPFTTYAAKIGLSWGFPK